jgi:hypothetical protein
MAAIVLSAAVAVASPIRAQGPTGSFASGISCTNLDTALPATLVLTFYQENNSTLSLSYTDPNTVAPGATRLYFTPNSPPGLAAGFLGSAVVSSDRALACNVNTQAVGTGVGTAANPARVASSAGLDSSQAAAVLYAPQVIKGLGGFNSYMAIQNTDSTAIQVTVSYVGRDGVAVAAANETVSIPSQATKVFYQAANTNLPANFLGAATVTSTGGKLVGSVAFYNSGASAQTAQMHAYNTVSAGSNVALVPRVVRQFYAFNSGISIMNVGTAATTATITFNFDGVSYVVTTPSIPAGGAFSPYAPDITQLAPVDALPVGKRTGSARIQAAAGGSIVAILNEDNRGVYKNGLTVSAANPAPAEFIGFGSTYNAFVDGTGTTKVTFPQIVRRAGGIFSGGFQVLNAGAGTAACAISYAGAAGANQNVNIPANQSASIFSPDVPNLPDGFNGGVTVSCNQTVYGISNFSSRVATYVGDTFTTANGLNQ